ncbi:30S ribosomal protein S20 [Buchnera aphidicola (Taiwanaphis decaspermi)]|uniref:30S ribosomal protein S20 n=1 Tax=Buchnera aphidicola TaxID=9 RepID=UPI0031B8566A
MANIKSSKKDSIKSKKRKKKNISQKSLVKNSIKKVDKEINMGNLKKAELAFLKMQSILDKHVNKGLIHKNKAARHKSNLFFKIKKKQ